MCCDASYKIESLLQKAELGSTWRNIVCATCIIEICCVASWERRWQYGQQRFSTCNATMLRYKLSENVARISWIRERARWSKSCIRIGYPTRPLRISRVGPAFRHIIHPLFTKLVRSSWMNVGHAFFQPRPQGTFPGDEVGFFVCFEWSRQKELGQYPAILTSRLVTNAYSLAHSR